MKDFLIPLTVASTGARIYVNPEHIIFVREGTIGEGTQIVTSVINDGMVMPLVKETVEEVHLLCRDARARGVAS